MINPSGLNPRLRIFLILFSAPLVIFSFAFYNFNAQSTPSRHFTESNEEYKSARYLEQDISEGSEQRVMDDLNQDDEDRKENSKKPFENPRPTPDDLYFPAPTPKGSQETEIETDSKETEAPTSIPYQPGFLKTRENGLTLSEGLVSRIVAKTGEKVKYANGGQSDSKFHSWPDGGSVFTDTRVENPGGWVYVSNSEEDIEGKGGVGALTFDASGNIIDYKMVLSDTTMNCNGGKTHFGAWISCEEDFWARSGKAWQVDPLGIREPQPITMSIDGGIFEAFAEDVRDMDNPKFFLTEDDYYGELRRWQPTNPDWSDPWGVLLGNGTLDYLVLLPDTNNHTRGFFTWIDNKRRAQQNAGKYYPNSEGIAVYENKLYFVCKRFSHLFELDLDKMTYKRHSTKTDLFDGTPDGIVKYVQSTVDGGEEALLYFTEDGGDKAGIHARNIRGEIVPILEGEYEPETTGLSFTPDGKRLYFAFQEDGLVFEVRRIDGKPFHAKTFNIKQHQFEGDVSVVSDRRQRRYRRH